MQTEKKWVKGEKSTYILWDNNQQIGKLEIVKGAFERRAMASFQGEELVIKKVGLWKSNLEITAPNGQILAKVYAKKWYANSYILEEGNKQYQLIVRNNPLAEWTIQDNHKDVLSYGLSTKEGKVCVKITSALEHPNYLFDIILWYLFEPIASENGVDDLTFLLLIA